MRHKLSGRKLKPYQQPPQSHVQKYGGGAYQT
jgi:hypothetical protein